MNELSGIWLFNNILDFSDITTTLEEELNTSANFVYNGINYKAHGTRILIYPDNRLLSYVTNIEPALSNVTLPNYLYVYNDVWVSGVDIGARKVDFGNTPISVSDTLFNFVIRNARQIEGITNGFEISLLKNTAEQNRLDKTNFIEYAGLVYGVLRNNTSITNPIITIQYDKYIDFNYVYIPEFNRYYFVTDVTIVSNKLYDLSLSVDVLMSYRTPILNCKGFIDRSESLSNPYLVDNKRVILEGRNTDWNVVQNELFTNTSGWYVLNGLMLGTHGGN